MAAKILSLGKDPTIVRARNVALEGDGHVVTSATRVEEALRLIATEKYDLAIVGYTFNRAEKRQLVGEIRAAGMPVLLLYLDRPDPDLLATEYLNIFGGTATFLATVRTMLSGAAASLEIVDYHFAPQDVSQAATAALGLCRIFMVSVKGYKPDRAAVRNFRLQVCTPASITAAMREGSRYCFCQNLLVVEQYDVNLVLEAIRREIEGLPHYACEVESFEPEEKPVAEGANSTADAPRDL